LLFLIGSESFVVDDDDDDEEENIPKGMFY